MRPCAVKLARAAHRCHSQYMRLRALTVAAVALLLSAVAAGPAVACPSRASSISPPAGGLLREGDAITVTGMAAYRLAHAGELRLWSTDHQIPLRAEVGPGVRVRLIPTAPIVVGTQYHLVAATESHPGYKAALGASSPWWTAAVRDRQAELGTFALRLAAFGFLPFGLAYALTRTIIIRRRRRIVRDL